MRIAVAGATGLAGRRLVRLARKEGHEVVELARSRGFNLEDGSADIAAALAAVDAVVDVTNAPTQDESEATQFFEKVAENLGKAAMRAAVKRIVVLSIVGVDRTPEDGYFVAKLAHERATIDHAPAARVLRSTQFHEFAEQSFGWGLKDDICTVRDMAIQTVALDVVVRALLVMATDADARTHVEIGGPKRERLVELVAAVAARKSKAIRVETTQASDAIANGALLPGANATLSGPGFFDWLSSETRSRSTLEMLLSVAPTSMPSPPQVMTVTIELPPGDPGTPPHRHSGPVFGYMLEGEMVFELEGETERIIRAGEAFWEPGGDVIHYQAANHLAHARSRFVVVMMGVRGKPMLELVDADELHARRNRRGPARDAIPNQD